MGTYVVVAEFSPETDLPQMSAVLAEELAQVQTLRAEGSLGFVHVSPERGRVFLEVFADDEAAATVIVESLPMSPWWHAEFYLTAGPPTAAG